MRIVAWNCNMALHRKLAALLALRPDVAVLSECASPERLAERLGAAGLGCEPVWIGANRDKGLAVLAFNGYRARLAEEAYRRSLRFIAPIRIEGPLRFNLLAVWAQNFSDGIRRKRQPGPLRLALTRDYRAFLGEGPAIVAGDFNNNIFWDRPGYLINHSHTVSLLENYGLVSAYHHARGEAQGACRSIERRGIPGNTRASHDAKEAEGAAGYGLGHQRSRSARRWSYGWAWSPAVQNEQSRE